MKSIEKICSLLIVIFALAVAHPLPDNVLEQVEAKEDPTPSLLLMDPTGAALLLKDPTATALALKDPTATPLALKDPTAPALALKDPTAPALALKDPTAPALALKDPTASSYLQKLPAIDFVPVDMSQEEFQEQQDPEGIMFSEGALEAIYNDIPQESELQKEE